jgi:hypothetical protein
MGARLYEASLGRFSSRDLLFGEPEMPVSLNQYAYANGSPVTMWDPTGLGACTMPGECVSETDGGHVTHGGNPGSGDYDPSGLAFPASPSVSTVPLVNRALDLLAYAADFAEGIGAGSTWLAQQLRLFAWQHRGSLQRCLPAVCAAEAIEDSLVVRGSRLIRTAGTILVVASGVAGYAERRAEGQGRYEAAIRQALETAGGVGGAALGVSTGALCGPAAPVCSGVFAVVVSAGGQWLGDRLGDFLYEGSLSDRLRSGVLVDLPILPGFL